MTQSDGPPPGPDAGSEDQQPTQALPAYPAEAAGRSGAGSQQSAASGQSDPGWAPPGSTPPGPAGGQSPWQPGGYGGGQGYQQTPVYGSTPAYGSPPAYGSTPAYGSAQPYGSQPAYGSAPNYQAGPAYGPDPGYGRPAGYIPPDWQPTAPLGTGQQPPNGPMVQSGRPRSIAGRVLALAAIVALFAGLLGAVGGIAASRRIWPVASAPAPSPANNGPAVFSTPQPVGTVAKALLPSVVQIRVMSGTSGVTGSGFVISSQGMIATNNHVVAEAAAGAELSVVFEDGDEAKARVVGRSPSYDLAVIKVEAGARKLDPVVLGDSDALDVGDPVIAIGAPLGLIGTVTTGIISAKNRPVTTGESGENSYMSALQTDAAINPGNSGGPLVDMRGRVVGVNSAIASLGTSMGGQSGSIGLGFSIPVNQVKRVTNEIIRTGKATYPIIGAEIDPTYSGTGARITTVQPGSPAAQAGLKDGDVITAVDGTKVTTGVELIVKIRSNVPGGTIKLTTGIGSAQHVYAVRLGSKDG